MLDAFAKGIFFTPHVLHQMNAPDRLILRTEVEEAIKTGEVIEDYQEDVRGHSCLMLGNTSQGRTIHVVCAPKKNTSQ